MYGKKISKPLRKLGHVNVVGAKGENTTELLEKLEKIKDQVQTVPSH